MRQPAFETTILTLVVEFECLTGFFLIKFRQNESSVVNFLANIDLEIVTLYVRDPGSIRYFALISAFHA